MVLSKQGLIAMAALRAVAAQNATTVTTTTTEQRPLPVASTTATASTTAVVTTTAAPTTSPVVSATTPTATSTAAAVSTSTTAAPIIVTGAPVVPVTTAAPDQEVVTTVVPPVPCTKEYMPVCVLAADTATNKNITFPNSCTAKAKGFAKFEAGVCADFMLCESEYRPVCAKVEGKKNGKTFPNACVAEKFGYVEGGSKTVVNEDGTSTELAVEVTEGKCENGWAKRFWFRLREKMNKRKSRRGGRGKGGKGEGKGGEKGEGKGGEKGEGKGGAKGEGKGGKGKGKGGLPPCRTASGAGTSGAAAFGATIRIIGDSCLSGDGVQTELARQLDTTVTNCAVGGASLSDIYSLQTACSQDENCPKWSIVGGGRNGVGEPGVFIQETAGTATAEDTTTTLSAMKVLVDREVNAGRKVIMFMYPPDRHTPDADSAINRFQDEFKQNLVDESRGVYMYDPREDPRFDYLDPNSRQYRATDDSHPSELAREEMGKAVATMIQQLTGTNVVATATMAHEDHLHEEDHLHDEFHHDEGELLYSEMAETKEGAVELAKLEQEYGEDFVEVEREFYGAEFDEELLIAEKLELLMLEEESKSTASGKSFGPAEKLRVKMNWLRENAFEDEDLMRVAFFEGADEMGHIHSEGEHEGGKGAGKGGRKGGKGKGGKGKGGKMGPKPEDMSEEEWKALKMQEWAHMADKKNMTAAEKTEYLKEKEEKFEEMKEKMEEGAGKGKGKGGKKGEKKGGKGEKKGSKWWGMTGKGEENAEADKEVFNKATTVAPAARALQEKDMASKDAYYSGAEKDSSEWTGAKDTKDASSWESKDASSWESKEGTKDAASTASKEGSKAKGESKSGRGGSKGSKGEGKSSSKPAYEEDMGALSNLFSEEEKALLEERDGWVANANTPAAAVENKAQPTSAQQATPSAAGLEQAAAASSATTATSTGSQVRWENMLVEEEELFSSNVLPSDATFERQGTGATYVALSGAQSADEDVVSSASPKMVALFAQATLAVLVAAWSTLLAC